MKDALDLQKFADSAEYAKKPFTFFKSASVKRNGTVIYWEQDSSLCCSNKTIPHTSSW